jgi:site-specific DNA recombinase
MTSTTGYAAIYARLSPRPDGSYEGVPSQVKWGRAYAAQHWPGVPVKVFADKAISAANGDHRPGFEELREAVARGEVAYLWSVEQTRLERREVEWFRLAAELDAGGIVELHTNRDGIVRVRDEVAGIKAVLAAGEVRKLKRRVNDRLAEIAADGRPAGSRVYGYRHALDDEGKKTLHIVESEAAVVREAAEKILAGWSLSRIAAELHGRGLHGPHRRKVKNAAGEVVDTRPSTITNQTVRSMVTNATVAGWRTHKGRQTRGVWEPILDQQTWDAVRDKLSAPRTVKQANGHTYPISGAPHASTARKYLLTGGTAVCGVCGAPLVASMKQLKRGRVEPYYLCHPKVGGRACIGILGTKFEEHVVATLLDELDRPDFRQALAEDEHAARRDEISTALRVVEGKRRRLAARWASEDDMDEDEWQTARRGLIERERELRAELAAVPPPVARTDLDLIREAWPLMNLDERREIVGMFVERVVVKRATPGTTGFDPRRVAVEWRKR